MGRTWNKTCEECGDPFVATGVRQRECDSCWGKARGAIRVEYRPRPDGRSTTRIAIIVCRKCETEYATRHNDAKYPGLCPRCSTSAGMKAPQVRAKIGASHRGRTHTPEHRAKVAAASRKSNREKKIRGIAQGGKFGFIYVVAGAGQVKVGGSMDADTLAQRLAQHAANGLADVCGTWQVDPRGGATLEAQALAAVLSEWDQVGTTIRPDGGTETVWCDDPQAVVAIVDEISRGCPRKT